MATNQPLRFNSTREFRAFHDFLHAARGYRLASLYEDAYRAYQRAYAAMGRTNGKTPRTIAEVNEVIDRVPDVQLYFWMMRHVQRFKYSHADWGILEAINTQADRLVPQLERLAEEGLRSGELQLNPAVRYPDYFALVDFHQHPGGLSRRPLDGMVYEMGRAVRFARGTDPRGTNSNNLYRFIFRYLPPGRYHRVLDWGTSFGAGVRTWLQDHPESEVYGVDLAAPCLKLAYARGREAGIKAQWSQQDLEHLDFADDFFDLSFFVFMLHELAPGHMPALFREVHRVLKPGGVFIGMELVYLEDSPFQQALQDAEGWINNEPFMPACFKTDFDKIFRQAGFSKVEIMRFDEMADGATPSDPGVPPRQTWNIFRITK